MTALPWPLAFKPASQEFYLRSASTQFVNPLTNQVQVLERDGTRWATTLQLTLSQGEVLAFDAFLASVRGPAGQILVPDFRRLTAAGSLAGSPVLAAGTGRTLSVTGFSANAIGVLKAGDLIQTSPGRGHLVVADVSADAAGSATVPIEPRLRQAVTVGPLVTATVRVLMRLVSDDAGRNPTKPPLKAEYSVELAEILPTV